MIIGETCVRIVMYTHMYFVQYAQSDVVSDVVITEKKLYVARIIHNEIYYKCNVRLMYYKYNNTVGLRCACGQIYHAIA